MQSSAGAAGGCCPYWLHAGIVCRSRTPCERLTCCPCSDAVPIAAASSAEVAAGGLPVSGPDLVERAVGLVVLAGGKAAPQARDVHAVPVEPQLVPAALKPVGEDVSFPCGSTRRIFES